jgi:hypothetical protein
MQLAVAPLPIANHSNRELPAYGVKLTMAKRRITFGSTIDGGPPAIGTVAAHTSALTRYKE